VSKRHIVIIGAGLAGLATGCYAQMNGYQSHIFEHHSKPGGVAAAWKRADYLIDGGIHFVMGYRPGTALYNLYHELGIVPACRFVDMTTYGRFLDEASGRSVVVTRDLDRVEAGLKAVAPADSRIVDELITMARAMQGPELTDFGMGRPPELAAPLDLIKELWRMRRLFKYFTGRLAWPVTQYVQAVQDPWLRDCLKYLFLPEVPVWFIGMMLGLVAAGQVGFLEGGCPDFVLPIEHRYTSLGGQVTYRATVEEILVAADRAVGVRLADGSEHRADVAVSAADGYSTLFKMLGGRYVSKKIEKQYANWEPIRPMVMVSYGVAREFRGEPSFTTILLEKPLTLGDQAVDAIFVRVFNYSSRFAPPGKTVVQVEFETQWDYWNDLQSADRAGYDAEKERIAGDVLQRLEHHYPRLSSQVEVIDVATPYTTWRYTLNHKGAWGGWLPTPEVMNARIARTLPGLANFYLAGQWVTPGASVPSSLYSGRDVVEILCRRDGKPFLPTLP
jgi:phytoene desaturase